jgi:hypothetical protein
MKKLLGIFFLALLLLCICTICGIVGAGRLLEANSPNTLPNDCPEIIVSQDAAIDFLTNVATALQRAPQTGQVRLTMTEEEITSVVALSAQLAERVQSLQNLNNLSPEQLQRLKGLEDASQLEALQNLLQSQKEEPTGLLPDLSLRLTLEEPQICMKEDQGLVIRGYASVRDWRQPVRIITAPRAAEGELVLDFVEGNLGQIPMPEMLFDLLGKGISGAILAGQEYVEVTEISVGDGTLTLAGQLKHQQ